MEKSNLGQKLWVT